MAKQVSVQRATIEGQRFLENRLLDTRHLSHELVAPLTAEDMVVQAMEDASPTKWHLAHVTWFFETFILTKHLPGYRPFDDAFNYCFNSYYETARPAAAPTQTRRADATIERTGLCLPRPRR